MNKQTEMNKFSQSLDFSKRRGSKQKPQAKHMCEIMIKALGKNQSEKRDGGSGRGVNSNLGSL